MGGVLALLLSGCGGGGGKVTGVVTLDGQPLPSGTVSFLQSETKQSESAPIGEDGTYSMAKAPVGACKVTVSVPPSMAGPIDPTAVPGVPRDKAKDPSLPSMPDMGKQAKVVPIPAHYSDPDKSGLTFTVKSGAQTFDIKLKEK